MNKSELINLKSGDIVQGKSYGLGYIVVDNLGDRVIAIREVEMTNPIEWSLIQKNTKQSMHWTARLALKIIGLALRIYRNNERRTQQAAHGV